LKSRTARKEFRAVFFMSAVVRFSAGDRDKRAKMTLAKRMLRRMIQSMKATLEKVAEEALSLPASDRVALTRILIHALDADVVEHPADVEAAWQAEVEKRLDEVLSGRVKTIPAAEVFAELRGKYG
jgi:putative addiction module component (TIGR02574 family)